MGPTWVLSAPDGPHVGLMNLAICDYLSMPWFQCLSSSRAKLYAKKNALALWLEHNNLKTVNPFDAEIETVQEK